MSRPHPVRRSADPAWCRQRTAPDDRVPARRPGSALVGLSCTVTGRRLALPACRARQTVEVKLPRRPHLIGPDRFGLLLAVVLASFVVTPFVQEREYGGLILGGQSALIMVLALTSSGVSQRRVVAGTVIVTVAAFLLASESLVGDGPATAWTSAVVTVMLALTPFLVLRRVLSAPKVTVSSVAGTLSAYLLVGMTFGSLYRTISVMDVEAFSQELGSASNYFSFVTLTTLGFGDIVAVSDMARSLVTLEAVLGQVLLVTLVARSVSTLGQQWGRERQ